MNALCVVIDGLHIGYLGCYGNARLETPAIDRLATEGLVFDQAYTQQLALETTYRSYWHGAGPWSPALLGAPSDSLAAHSQRHGVTSGLLTDSLAVSELPAARDFGEVRRVSLPAGTRRAATAEQSQFGLLFDEAAKWLRQVKPPFFLWLHAQGMYAPWDAPPSLLDEVAADLQAARDDVVDAPRADARLLGTLRTEYAAQVMLLDGALAHLLNEMTFLRLLDTTMVLFASPRGYSLGEHGRWMSASGGSAVAVAGSAAVTIDTDRPLFAEEVHVPFIVRPAQAFDAGDRSQSLVAPPDVAATLTAALTPGASLPTPSGRDVMTGDNGSGAAPRDRICLATGRDQWAIRTEHWYLRWSHADKSDHPLEAQLFVKPDDRWDFNDVADRCGEVVEPLRGAFTAGIESEQAKASGSLAPLDPALLQRPE